MTAKTFSTADLRQFTGTEHWYRHGLVRHVLFTDPQRSPERTHLRSPKVTHRVRIC